MSGGDKRVHRTPTGVRLVKTLNSECFHQRTVVTVYFTQTKTFVDPSTYL
nr:MAG: ORF3 [Torque teno polar bear virus 44]